MKWESIETAPANRFLLVYSGHPYIGAKVGGMGKWVGFSYDSADSVALNRYPPSHWAPLPGAPDNATSEAPWPFTMPMPAEQSVGGLNWVAIEAALTSVLQLVRMADEDFAKIPGTNEPAVASGFHALTVQLEWQIKHAQRMQG